MSAVNTNKLAQYPWLVLSSELISIFTSENP